MQANLKLHLEIKREPPPPPPPVMPLWRVKHDVEMGPIWRPGLPEVFPLNGEVTPFEPDWQRLTFAMNPGMDPEKWRVLYDYRRAFMNKTGFNRPGDPRADYVSMRDLTYPLPRWDKTRVCGGATITGRMEGAYLIVEIMDGRGPAPTLDWLEIHPWFRFRAVNCGPEGNITNFPQNGGQPIFVPLVGNGVAKIPLSNLESVTEIADPYKI